MRHIKSLYTFFFGIFWSSNDLLMRLTPITIKFIIMGGVAAIVAVYMMYDDEHSENPTIKQILIALLTSVVFVWLSYEATVHWNIPVVIGLIMSFAFGLSALPVIKKIREKLPESLGDLMDHAVDGAKGWLNRKK